MLRRAVLPLVRPRPVRPLLVREAIPQAPLRYYRRDQGVRGDDCKIPSTTKNSNGDTPSPSTQPKEPLRRVPFPLSAEPSKNDQPSASESFGVDPTRDIDEVSESVSQSSRTFMGEKDKQRKVPENTEPEPEPEEPESQPRQPLPDLTQGIPSTLDAELKQARAKQSSSPSSLNITEDPSEELPSGAGRGRGGDDIPRQEYISSSDRKRDAVFRYMYIVMGLSLVGSTVYLGRNWENEEEEKAHADTPSGWGIGLFYNRLKTRIGSMMSYYRDPVTTKLLPDEDPDPNLRFPFTLVISLEDMLIHSEWTREKGWRIAKRPGVDYFLRYLGAYYEIVLFTSQPMTMAEQVLRKLDPYQTIRWPLFREATLYKDGGYIKDLSYLNRDLKRVLIMDTDPHHVKHQPENAIVLPKWTGDVNDQTLVQFIPFLEYLATMGFEDVREVLKSFEGTYIPAEFDRRIKLLRQKFEAQEAEKRKGRPKKTVPGLTSMLGLKSQDSDESMGEGKMLWDQIRERGQKQYMEFEKKIKEEGEKWLAEKEAEEKRFQEEAMKNMRLGGWFSGIFGGRNKEEEKKK
ncbi:uncharacterized protein Z518_10740 [Rhinocladiella mackenziei CBS 650.93]|uniref:Mitochondrial import inner membrane translocase subunit TIM50 n=1 Tax=Rhinocladiella mackenziei CBS 650.93 TaxID=1442369 RepID=A0A0D2GN52_9EURO|nr:uncharacterized protein Z518_10740 [Rhinocladiella mackenziei CBS 650.93]KIW99812.1 hypothetical protein Z518_10740 [Rhinocladiella mackenziei CBS 650.93]